MPELIERLEKATGPDRELDFLIFDNLHYGSFVPHDEVPLFTASVDAALRLVPEGWAWSIHAGDRESHRSAPRAQNTGSAKPLAALAEPVQTEFGPGVGVRAQAEAVTPAIALCIAALKARNSPGTP